MKLHPFATLYAALSVTLTHAGQQTECDLSSIQMSPSQSDNDHPRAQVYGDDNYVQRCKDAGGDVISFSGRTVCKGIPNFPYDRTDRNWPLCVPPSCTEDDLEEAIAQQLFGDEIWDDWEGADEIQCTGSYEFEGMGSGHSEVLQCFFDAQDSYDPVMRPFDRYQDEMKEDYVSHTLSLDELKKLCDDNDMDYFEASWRITCNKGTKHAAVFKEHDLPRCLPKSCTAAGEFSLVENWYDLNFARQPSICEMTKYSFTGLSESVPTNAPPGSTPPGSTPPGSTPPVQTPENLSSRAVPINIITTLILLAIASWSVAFLV